MRSASLSLISIALSLAISLSGQAQTEARAARQRPNIVFIFVDDMGWTDPGYMDTQLGIQQGFHETPHINQLAKQGVVFTNAYAAAPNCAPSRACLMSGQYGPRHGVYTVGDPSRGNHKSRRLVPIANRKTLREEIVTLPEALARSQYVSASIGKWHLGPDPTLQGFDVNIAGKQWGSPSGGGYHSPYDYPHLKTAKNGEYLSDRLGLEACKFIEKNKGGPFFLFLSHYAVHTPIQAKRSLVKKYRAKSGTASQTHAAYAAMIESVDQSVGAILATLRSLELDKNTLVIFTSDNGGYARITNNAPLRGGKGMLYEGGIRVPLIVHWPGVTKAGSESSEPIINLDFYPTLLEATQTQAPPAKVLDGMSFVPVLRDPKRSLKRKALFWHFPCYLQGSGDPGGGPFRTTPAAAIRAGDWKLIEWFESGRLELYNLKSDVSEQLNLASQEVETRQRLQGMMKTWRNTVSAPIPTDKNPRFDPTFKPPKSKRRGR